MCGGDPGLTYAADLLRHLGGTIVSDPGAGSFDAALLDHDLGLPCPLVVAAPSNEIGDWARSGAMYLTGEPKGPPLPAPGTPATAARGAALAVELLSSLRGHRVRIDGPVLLGERAALAGFRRGGMVSAGGACKLLATRDGHVAVNLPRAEDFDLAPAWLERPVTSWDEIASECRGRLTGELVERAALVGLAVAAPPGVEPDAQLRARGQVNRLRPWLLTAGGRANPPVKPLVVDLSALWAGPLCAHLLQRAGCRVVKVEAVDRPDGSRSGAPAFFSLMNEGKEPANLADLVELLHRADVVIESSRPRAMDQKGISPDDFPSTVWVSITGYGRSGPWSNRPAFGDDAAVAGGLVAGGPVFAGDAIADPLTGLHAASAALAALAGRWGGLVDVPLREVSAYVATREGSSTVGEAVRDGDGWQIDGHRVEMPRARDVGR